MTLENKLVESDIYFRLCRDFLCPPETRLQEWFPTEIQARVRARALDPYGLMIVKNNCSLQNGCDFSWKCKNENCHARYVMRKVDPDPEGNTYGLFGCNQHQHPFPRNEKSEIIFKDKADAEEFYDKNLKMMYRIQNTARKNEYRSYLCRRKKLKEGMGHHPCQSGFVLSQSFIRAKSSISNDKKPHSIVGIFYHPHKNEEEYHKDKYGGWAREKPIRAKFQRKKHPEVRNNKVYPVKCREKYTVEDVLEAQKSGRSLTY